MGAANVVYLTQYIYLELFVNFQRNVSSTVLYDTNKINNFQTGRFKIAETEKGGGGVNTVK